MADAQVLPTPLVQRRRILVRGVVQGVGFRPFVARLADDLHLMGHCGNDAVSVFVEAEGPAGALDELVRRIREEAPPLSTIVALTSAPLPPAGDTTFEIVPSRDQPGARTLVAPDTATCADCLRELADPGDRRYRHAFITCTNCGPRFTIIEDLPYDRPATTMAGFTLCDPCREEYADPADRRHHAQPISCHDCGPRLWAETLDGERIDGDDAILLRAQQTLCDGGIVAIKGVGGFHLTCDPTNPDAVATLRTRKHRLDKPFAVMAADLAAARRIARLSDAEERALTGPARPIVLLGKAPESPLVDGVAPGLDEIGVLLPYSPLHQLLFTPLDGTGDPGDPAPEPLRVLVMTSGNLSDEPLCHTNADARERLAGIADLLVMHDREIAVPCDDSVVAVWDDTELPIRRSRGYAPLPVVLPDHGPITLAVGAEVKNTFCLTREDFAFCSGHLGDMVSLESQAAFTAAVRQLTALHAACPELVVADDHPGYAIRAWAERYADQHAVPLVTVQHHHAHVASLLAEHGLTGTPAIGVAFDGTGYGCDRTVWGGEFLAVGTDVRRADRVGHLESFWLPGGDRAVRNPFRVAIALLHAAGMTHADGLDLATACSPEEQRLVWSQLASGTACVSTTSMGRLFDGVSSLLGVRHQVSYEGQAAIELEALARSATAEVPLRMEVADRQLGLVRLVHDVVDGVRSGEPRDGLALGFHRALASATAELVRQVANERKVSVVGLTGGVFQNRLLLGELTGRLAGSGLTLLTHRLVPPNDGGLSLGQAVVGRALARRTPTGQEDQA